MLFTPNDPVMEQEVPSYSYMSAMLNQQEVDGIWETARTGTAGGRDELGLRCAAKAIADMVRVTYGEVLEKEWKVRV